MGKEKGMFRMRRLLGAALAAAAIVTAGCGADGTSSAPKTSSLGNYELTAAQALQRSAERADDVTSYIASLNLDIPDYKEGPVNAQATVRYQEHPRLAWEITLDRSAVNGNEVPGGVRVILFEDVAYAQIEMLKGLLDTDKPWLKIDLKQRPADRAKVDRIFEQFRSADLKSNLAMLTASKDVEQAGREPVGGVETTHYSGTFPVEEALRLLPAEQRAKVTFPPGGEKVKFDVWVDDEGLPRKLQLSEVQTGIGTATATVFFKSFNEPMSIEAPPADQTGELPEEQVPSLERFEVPQRG